MIARRLFASLATPSRFEGDPYGGLLNQWGHYTLGVVVYILVCSAWFFFWSLFGAGEMPPRWDAAGVVIAAYLLGWEIWRQGWQGRDTLEDTGFFAGGVLTVASSVQEIAASGWRSEIVVDLGYLVAAIIAMSWACIAYAVSRYRG